MARSAAVPFQAARRGHVVDDVFAQLSAAILRGELPADEALPPERVLAERFSVSRIMIRQAMHRLAEHGLVRVRQGGATLACDPESSTDPRVIAMLYQAAPSVSPALLADMAEKQCMQGLGLVDVATRRASRTELDALVALVDATASDDARLTRFDEFEAAFWGAVAACGKNRIFQKEVAWWQRVVSARPIANPVPPKKRIAFFAELARRMRADDDAVGYYLGGVRPLLDALFPRKARRR